MAQEYCLEADHPWNFNGSAISDTVLHQSHIGPSRSRGREDLTGRPILAVNVVRYEDSILFLEVPSGRTLLGTLSFNNYIGGMSNVAPTQASKQLTTSLFVYIYRAYTDRI